MKKLLLNIFLIVILFSKLLIFAQDMGAFKIGIVHSERTKQLIYSHNKSFYPVQDWELFFLNRKISYTIISDEQLDNNNFEFLDVLILPSVEVISESAEENLNRFLNDGKGLLVFGKIGVYDEDGKEKYANFIQNNGGFRFTELSNKKIHSENLTLTSSILTKKLKKTADLIVLNDYNPLIFNSTDKEIEKGGKYILNVDTQTSGENSGIILSKKSNGKIAWFGFQLSQILSDKSQENIVERLIFNAIDWLSPIPVLLIKPWPQNYTLPVLISSTIIDSKSLSPELIGQLFSNNVNLNFFLDAKEIESMDEIMSKLVSVGDINLFLNSQLSINQVNDSLLQRQYEFLYSKSRQKYFGLKLNEYQFSGNRKEISQSPFNFISLEDKSINFFTDVESGKKSEEEMNIPIVSYSNEGNDYEGTLRQFSLFFNSAINNGKVVLINVFDESIHGQKLEVSDSFWRIVDYLREQNSWITTCSELIKWAIQRENVNIETSKTENYNVFQVVVENRNQSDIKNLSLQLFTPALKFNPQVSNSNFQLTYDPELKSYTIVVPYIRPGTKEVFYLEFGDNR